MITKLEILINLSAKNTIVSIKIKVEIDCNKYKITKQKFSANKTKESTIRTGAIESVNSGFEVYNQVLESYKKLGYIKVSSKMQPSQYYDYYIKEMNMNYPRVMKLYEANDYANTILEREWMFCKYYEHRVTCILYTEKNELKLVSEQGFFLNTDMIPDGLEEYVRTSKKMLEIVLNEGTILVSDYISDIPFNKRYENLIDDRQEYESEGVRLLEYGKVSGNFRVQNRALEAIKSGYKGIVLKNPLKPYRQGEISTLLKIFVGVENTMVCKVIDIVDKKIIIVDTNKQFVRVNMTIDKSMIGKRVVVWKYCDKYYGHEISNE